MWADAVFEGGGIKGIGLVGALQVAEEKGYRWKRVAGTSAGSILAALIAAGYTAEEMRSILVEKEFLDLIPSSLYDSIPYIGPTIRVWLRKGIYSTKRLEKWLTELLAAKGVHTFADLTGPELHIIASDISLGNLVVLPKDLTEYGIDPARYSVAKAVTTSCSIPFFFEPRRIYHQRLKETSYLVDGAVLSNFPVWLFDEEQPRWPTFGFRLTSNLEAERNHIRGPITMFRALFETMMEAHDNHHIREQDQVRTIQVPPLDVRLTDFAIDRKKREALYLSGVQAATQFFEKWTFNRYLQARGFKDKGKSSPSL